MLASPWFSADVCSVMALYKHLYHYSSNGSMSVALCPKFQLDPHCNLAVRKSDEHTKHSWFANRKIYSLLPFIPCC